MSTTEIAVPGVRIVRLGAVGSTNDEAKRLAAEGCADRTIVWAEEQRQGKGRHGRVWVSPPGNLYVSIVLRPRRPQTDAAQAGFVAALALAETIDQLLPGASSALALKWPNDVLIGGAKVSGILLEGQGGAGRDGWIVLGMGVNVASHPTNTGRPTTSLRQSGYSGSLENLLKCLLEHLVAWLDVWEAEGFAKVRMAWLSRTAPNKPITIRLGPETLSGRFSGIDERGGLILAQNGRTRVVTAGEVFENAG